MTAPPDAPPIDQRRMLRLLVAAAGIGILGGIGAVVFMVAVEEAQKLVFEHLPAALGLAGTPWWWAALLLLVAATIVVVAQRMRGGTASGPLSGFHFDTPVEYVPSVLVAAFGSLAFGVALGPEAPLIVLGSTLGVLVLRRQGEQAGKAGAVLGGTAAIGAVFGNPFVTAFMLLEFAAFGAVPATLIPAILLALGASYLVQIGIWEIPGVGTHDLTVPGLPAYDSIQVGDLAIAAVAALAAAALIITVRETGLRVDGLRTRRPTVVLYVAAALTGVVLLVTDAGFDIPLEQVLFSGQTGMPGLLAETAVGTVAVVLAAKAIAYALALGSGFRGGPVFPATFLGVGVAVLLSLVLPSTSVTALAAAGIAAASAAMIKLPASSALLGFLLIGAAGAAVAPFAILGAIIGLIVRLAADRRQAPH